MMKQLSKFSLWLIATFLFLGVGLANAQDRTIAGKVIDEEKSPIPGVNVIVKNTSQGTVTDIEGNYTLEIPNAETILVFSSVGFVKEEIAVGTLSIIDVTMQADITALDEIVVVGYGVQQKANVTGATGSIEMDKVLGNRPVTNASIAL